MEVSIKSYKHCQVVSVQGRVDSSTAPKLTETFEALHRDGVSLYEDVRVRLVAAS